MSTTARRSRQAPDRSRGSGRSFLLATGFTLVELLLVVVLIGLLCAVSFPRLSKPVRATGLRESADVLAETVRFVRVEAIRRGVSTCFRTDGNGTTYWFEIQDREAGRSDAFTRFERGVLDEVRTFPMGVHIEHLEEGEQTMSARMIVFTPNGVSARYRILLESSDGQGMSVEIGELFDQVVAVPTTPDGTRSSG